MKTYIWSLPTRVFHWSLVLFVAISFLSSEEDSLLRTHVAFGYGIAVLILFRVIWGFIGEKYSRYKELPISIKEAIEFGENIFTPKKKYLGHNPVASFVMVAIMIVLALSVVSGIFTYGIQEGRGVVSSLNTTFFKDMEIFEEIHEAFSSLLILLVGAHIAGVIVDRLLHKEDGVLFSMISGYKNIKGESIKLSFLQKVVAILLLGIALVMPLYLLRYESVLTSSLYKPIKYEKISDEFVQECSSCHTLYPPYLLPKNSWVDMMKPEALEDHFGDDASLDEETRVKIESFLVKYSAESSTKEAGVYVLQSMKNFDTISITKTPFWKKRHKEIEKEIFSSKKVRTESNCKACHQNIEQGLIEDSDIKIPKDSL